MAPERAHCEACPSHFLFWVQTGFHGLLYGLRVCKDLQCGASLRAGETGTALFDCRPLELVRT